MIFTDNDLTVSSDTYNDSQKFVGQYPCPKITLQVEDGTIYFQTLDRIHGYFSDRDPEVKVPPGFASFTFASPIYGIRWRRATAATTATLSYTYYV